MADDLLPDADLVALAKKSVALIDQVHTLALARKWDHTAPAAQMAQLAVGQWRDAIARSADERPSRHVAHERRGEWLPTYSGVRFYPLDPRPEDIRPEDIAHALSLRCRWNCIVTRLYTVAEHSCRVAALAKYLMQKRAQEMVSHTNMDANVRLAEMVRLAEIYGGIHDGNEAYLPDVARPIKRQVDGWAEVEDPLQRIVHIAFGLPAAPPAEVAEVVTQADNFLLLIESREPMFTEATTAELLYKRDIPEWLTTPEIEDVVRAPAEFLESWEKGRDYFAALLKSWHEQGQHAAAVAEDVTARASSGEKTYLKELASAPERTISDKDFEPPAHLKDLLS